MHANWKGAVALGCGCLLVVGVAFAEQLQERDAQRDPTRQRNQIGQRDQQTKKVCLASQVMRMSVKDSSQQDFGTVQDLVIGIDGDMKYIAIGTNDASDRNNATRRTTTTNRDTDRTRNTEYSGKLVLVPFHAAQFKQDATKEQSHVTVPMEKQRLVRAPSFTREQLTSTRDADRWMQQVDQYFGTIQRRAARPVLEDERDRNLEDDDTESALNDE